MLKLKIDDSDIELRRGEVVAITLQANSIEKPDSFQSSFSNSFDVLLTRSNRSVLGNLFAMGNSGQEYQRITGTSLTQDGLQIVSNGFAVVEEYNNQVATLTVYSGVNDFFDELGDEVLQCIDTSGEDFTWDFFTVRDGWNNVYTDGYVFAICNYGDVSENDVTIDTEYQHPSIFVKYLFNKVAELTSYTFKESDFFTDSFFERLVLPFSNPDLSNSTFRGVNNFGAFYILTPATVPILAYNIDEGNKFNTGRIPIEYAVGNTISYTCDFSQNTTTTAGTFTMSIKAVKSDGTEEVLASDTAVTNVGFSLSASYSMSCDFNNSNEYEYLYIEFDYVLGTGVVPPSLFPAVSIDELVFESKSYAYNDDYIISTSLPNLKASDFIKNIWLMFGVVPEVDLVTKEITLRTFEEFTTDYSNSIDLSNKVDVSKEILIENGYGGWSNENLFKYKEDDQLEGSEFADGNIRVSNALLESQSDWIELDFSASKSIGLTADETVSTLDLPVYDTSVSPVELSTSLEPRIGYVSYYRDSPVPTLNITDGANTENSVDFSIVSFINNEEDQNLNFNSLRGTYFDSLSKAIQAMKKLTVYLRLNAIDFNNINFFVPYYLSFSYNNIQIRGCFYLQKIDEYKAGETAKCEFIKLNPY